MTKFLAEAMVYCTSLLWIRRVLLACSCRTVRPFLDHKLVMSNFSLGIMIILSIYRLDKRIHIPILLEIYLGHVGTRWQFGSSTRLAEVHEHVADLPCQKQDHRQDFRRAGQNYGLHLTEVLKNVISSTDYFPIMGKIFLHNNIIVSG